MTHPLDSWIDCGTQQFTTEEVARRAALAEAWAPLENRAREEAMEMLDQLIAAAQPGEPGRDEPARIR